jgi:hypothetical protein
VSDYEISDFQQDCNNQLSTLSCTEGGPSRSARMSGFGSSTTHSGSSTREWKRVGSDLPVWKVSIFTVDPMEQTRKTEGTFYS